MIQDFCMVQENNTMFDLTINEETRDFTHTEGMETAINVQLFLDQRVTAQERANAQDRRGWIGDIETRDDGFQIGSLIHLQEQSREVLGHPRRP